MLFKMRSSLSITCKVLLLVLAAAVFSWGLQSKLDLYKPPASQKVALAKLSTEQNSAKLERALTQRDASLGFAHRLTLVLHTLSPLPTPAPWQVVQQAKIVLSHPGRLDLHGIYLLRRPPPSLS